MRPRGEAEGHVLPHRERVEEGCALEEHPEFAVEEGAFGAAQPRDVGAVHENTPGIGAQQTENAFESHRLAGAGGADDNQRFPARGFEVHAVEHNGVAEALRHRFEADCGVAAHAEKNSSVTK